MRTKNQTASETALLGKAETAAGTKSSAAAKTAPKPADGMRETVESVVVAFVLAFLFRTFEAEAFVIPTGSMAPTLVGRHKDLHCEKCQFPYRVTAKPEVDDEGARFRLQNGDPAIWMTDSVCPNCGYVMSLASQYKEGSEPSFAGDRILVAKFPYDIGEPKRWDVVVFKYPVRAHQNFIKRLVGLPNETVRILRGDIYVKAEGDADFTMARKPPDKVQAMMQTVYDNDYVLPSIIQQKGWPARWQAWALPIDEAVQRGWSRSSQPPLAAADEGWTTSADMKSFHASSKPGPVWLRYTHTPPSPEDWRSMAGDLPVKPTYQQILDFNAYNMGFSNQGRPHSGPEYWVGDLALQCEVQIASDSGELVLELVEGGVQFQCRIDVASGLARLSHSADPAFQPQQQTNVKGKGVYRLAFANVDDQLLLWVDGKVIPFEATYQPLGNTDPLPADYAPVGIAADGLDVRVSHLRIVRDIYYIANRGEFAGNRLEGEDFPLAADQFFVLGDNSAESLDARYWQEAPFGPPVRYVHRDLMTGKALLIYWPHSFDRIPGTDIYFPFFPNFERMGYVR
jgi:signal peptidase I